MIANPELQRQHAEARARRAKFFPPACRAMPAMVVRSAVTPLLPPMPSDAHVLAFRRDRVLKAKAPVLRAVALHTGVHIRDITGAARFKFCCIARQIAMFVLVTDVGMSRAAVGRYFNRDHTTVIHAVAVIGDRMQQDAKLAKLVALVRATAGITA